MSINTHRYQIDPENSELTTLLEMSGSLTGRSVLEVGCGSGRLTRRYATMAGRVVAIDPDEERIAAAIQHAPSPDSRPIDFRVADILDFCDPGRFDVAILSWSL